MNEQRRFDIGGQPSLFDDDERDMLDDIARQASEQDRAAAADLATWVRSAHI